MNTMHLHLTNHKTEVVLISSRKVLKTNKLKIDFIFLGMMINDRLNFHD